MTFEDLIQFEPKQALDLGYSKLLQVNILTDIKLIRQNPAKSCANELVIFLPTPYNIDKVAKLKHIDIIILNESSKKPDNFHFRNSLLSIPICQNLKKNKISLAISINEILNSEKKPVYMGRLIQDISLARKHKIQITLASFAVNKYEMRAPHEMVAFAKLMGLNPKEAKLSLCLISKIIEDKARNKIENKIQT